MSPTSLTLCYISNASNIGAFTPPEPRADWDCALVIQNPEDIAWRGAGMISLLQRDDVEIDEVESVDPLVALNRAVILARGEYLVFGNNNSNFRVEGLESAIEILDGNQHLSALATRILNSDESPIRDYYAEVGELTNSETSGLLLSELVIRKSTIQSLGTWFSKAEGIDTGELLVVELMKNGAKVGYSPVVTSVLK